MKVFCCLSFHDELSFECSKPFGVIQSSDIVESDNFCCIFCVLWRDGLLEILTLSFH